MRVSPFSPRQAACAAGAAIRRARALNIGWETGKAGRMRTTRTLYVNLDRLALQSEGASIVLRLMMVCNDLAFANAALRELKEREAPIAHRAHGAGVVYLLRMQMGHLSEGLSVIDDLTRDQGLTALVERCSQHAKNRFSELTACLKNGRNCKTFESRVMRVRNTTAFHYDGKLVKRALADLARTETRPLSATSSNDVGRVRFLVADAVLDVLTVRHIWKIEGGDIRGRVDEVLDFGYRLFLALLEFGQEFIMRYIETNAAR